MGALTYQAQALVERLKLINDGEFPPQACRIRDVLLCVSEFIVEQLWGLYNPQDPLGVRDTLDLQRMRSLSSVVQDLHSYLRYLEASEPYRAPPGIQTVLSYLTDRYFPGALDERAVCLVRPQWKYNLTYTPLSWYLRQLIQPAVLDPDQQLQANDFDGILAALWQRRHDALVREGRDPGPYDRSPPTQLAILSFAGLDTHDTLLYPLLAHELGHFIDFRDDPPLHRQDPLKTIAHPTLQEVEGAFRTAHADVGNRRLVNETWLTLQRRILLCLRELLADALATRMLGFAFFVAQAEFLKTVASWPQPTVTRTGYPGIRFRLWRILEQLLERGYPGNVRAFLSEHAALADAGSLTAYLTEWEGNLTANPAVQPPPDPLRAELDHLAELKVEDAIPDLKRVARIVIPDERCACLTERFFNRVAALRADVPPSCADDDSAAFGEILSAAWGYQILYGEQREIGYTTLAGQSIEYNKTCRLVLKAIELISAYRPDLVPIDVPIQHEQVPDAGRPARPTGTLTAQEIIRRLDREADHPLFVVPRYPDAIQAVSLDLRLGNWFKVARRVRLRSIDLGIESQRDLLDAIGKEEVFVDFGREFVIHPGDFVLGATLNFIALPADIMAFVEGKSSIGRMGLLIATATQVAPGFHGVLVLELANTGTIPLVLRPGMRIAQLVLQTATTPVPAAHQYRGRYFCQIKP